MRSSSPFIARAVRAITGMARVRLSLLSNAVASRPSIPGSWMSIRIRSGSSARANVSPTSASGALSTVWPADWSSITVKNMLSTLSSTIRILAMSGDHSASGHSSPDFGDKAVAAKRGLFHDRRNRAGQLGAVLGGDLLGGDHQDRNASRVGMIAERLHHVEAVHVRHHQIEHDQVRQLLPRNSDPLA